METPNCDRWSELPVDILRYLLERLSFLDFHRAKMVCSDWYLCSKKALRPKRGPPLLLLSPEEGGIRLYNPDEDRVYETKRDFSGYSFLGNSGKWFLVLDSLSDLYIIDVFSEERIRLPPLESIKGGLFWIERVDDKEFKSVLVNSMHGVIHQTAKDLRGLVWVDDKNGDYVVVWQFDNTNYLGFCKKGDVHYHEITRRIGLPNFFQRQKHMVLKGYSLYVLTYHDYILHLDLSGQNDKVLSVQSFPMRIPDLITDEFKRLRIEKLISFSRNIAVATSGEVFFVYTGAYESTSERHGIFLHVYKSDSNSYKTKLVDDHHEVYYYCLIDEALFLDLGITVPADHTLGIEPNSIYFTRDNRIPHKKLTRLDICVYNLAIKTTKRFSNLSKLKLKDAQWFLPS